MGIMEEKMETTMMGYMGCRIWGLGSKGLGFRITVGRGNSGTCIALQTRLQSVGF